MWLPEPHSYHRWEWVPALLALLWLTSCKLYLGGLIKVVALLWGNILVLIARGKVCDWGHKIENKGENSHKMRILNQHLSISLRLVGIDCSPFLGWQFCLLARSLKLKSSWDTGGTKSKKWHFGLVLEGHGLRILFWCPKQSCSPVPGLQSCFLGLKAISQVSLSYRGYKIAKMAYWAFLVGWSFGNHVLAS